MAGYFPGSVYADITDNAALDLIASGGWTFGFFVYPVSALSDPDFGYIYSHGAPASFVDAVNIIRGGFGVQPYNTVRCILDWPGGNLVDFTTTSTLSDDTWNHIMVSYQPGSALRIAINGTVQGTVPPALPDVQPAGNARIGYSVSGGTRNFPGRIAHAAKWDRQRTNTTIGQETGIFMSPEYKQNKLDWHIPMFTNQVHDDQGNLTVASSGMSWADHGPFIYPSKPFGAQPDAVPTLDGDSTYRYYRRC